MIVRSKPGGASIPCFRILLKYEGGGLIRLPHKPVGAVSRKELCRHEEEEHHVERIDGDDRRQYRDCDARPSRKRGHALRNGIGTVLR